MPKRVYGSQIITNMGEGTPNDISPELIRKEILALADFISKGGLLQECGPINKVVGVRLVVSYAMSVDAPDITWAEMDRRTKPDNAVVSPPNPPANVRQINKRKRRG